MRRIIIFCTILVFLAVQFASATSHIEQMSRNMQHVEEPTDHMLEETIQFMETQLENAGYEEQRIDEIITYVNYYIRSAFLLENAEITPSLDIVLGPIPGWLVVFIIVSIGFAYVLNDIYSFIACGGKDCIDFSPGDRISDLCYAYCCNPDSISNWPVCN